MKKSMLHKIAGLSLMATIVVILFMACTKDTDGSPDVKAGNPVATDLSPDSAAVSALLTLTGTGLGDMRTIVFDLNNAPSQFSSTLNTETSIIFRVPDTATRGQQNIVFTNSQGKQLKVPFKVLPFAVVNSIFPTDFEEGSLLTLTGNNLDVMTKVVLEGTTIQATIMSQSLNQAVVKMPATTLDKVKLVASTSAGDKVAPIELVNVAKALQVFRDDFVNPAQSWSWGGSYNPSTDMFVTGTKSLKAEYDPNGTWGGLQIGMGSELAIPAGTKYLTFWVRGADVEKKIKLQIQGNNWSAMGPEITVVVPPVKWTYFKYELNTVMPNINSVSVILFQMHDAGKLVYFDNIMFIK